MAETRESIVFYMMISIPSASGYWASARFNEGADGRDESSVTHVTVTDESTGTEKVLTPEDFVSAANEYAQHILDIGHPNSYHVRFAEAWKNMDWARVDYDSEIVDEIVQQALFGKQMYS